MLASFLRRPHQFASKPLKSRETLASKERASVQSFDVSFPHLENGFHDALRFRRVLALTNSSRTEGTIETVQCISQLLDRTRTLARTMQG